MGRGGGKEKWGVPTCECAAAYGPREHAGQIEHADALERVLDVARVREDPLGGVADLVDVERVDVRLVYALWGLVHDVIRA